MIGQEQTYTLANDASLTLPALSEGQMTIALKEEWIGFIRHTDPQPEPHGLARCRRRVLSDGAHAPGLERADRPRRPRCRR